MGATSVFTDTTVMGFSLRGAVIFVWAVGGVLALAPTPALAIPPAVQRLVYWETHANNIVTQSDAPEEASYYEVPLKLLRQHVANDLPPAVRKALVFERGGKEWFRWIIHPTDREVHPEIAEMLKTLGYPAAPVQGQLLIRRTASRSLVVEDPRSGAVFSYKVSTNSAPGEWKLKRQVASDTDWIGEFNDYASTIEKRIKLDHVLLLKEPWALSLKSFGADQGVIIRDLSPLAESKHLYLPALSALHEETGRMIAEKNGSSDPSEFWRVHFAQALGKAMAEWSAHFGVNLSSAHPQNFLIELTADYKPTGRIVFRDFADVYLPPAILKGGEFADLLKNRYYREPKSSNTLVVEERFNSSLTSERPQTWLKGEGKQKWMNELFQSYATEFERITGIPASQWRYLRESREAKYPTLLLKPEAIPSFRALLPCLQGHYQKSCGELLRKKIRPGAADIGKLPLSEVIPAQPSMVSQCKSILRKARDLLKRPPEEPSDW